MNQHRQTTDTATNRPERGSIVVYLALALVAFGVMAVAGSGRFGASILGVSAPNCATQARLMAESGVRYATAYLRTATSQAELTTKIADLHGKTYTVDAAKKLSFTLSVLDSGGGVAQVSATGQSCGGGFLPSTSATASASGGVNVPAAAAPPTPSDPVSPTNPGFGGGGWSTTAGFGGQAGATINASTGTLTLGNSLYANSASACYTGTSGVCTNGNCTLGNGMCAYFELKFTAGSEGDGFVWTLISGDTNTSASNGGDTGRGELVGYGGLGSSGRGIKPPKLGVEFDIYKNSGTASVCNVGNRADDDNGYDHVAHIFWGAQTVSGCDASYDDNRHGAGSGSTSEPMNARNDDGSGTGGDGYYYRSGGGGGGWGGWGGGGGSDDWLKSGGTFYYRYELNRSTTANANGDYCYQVRSWLKKSTDTFPSGLSNCTVPYSEPPDIMSVVNLSPAMHQKLTAAYACFTEGTGGATQLATLKNFTMHFNPLPTLPIVPKDYTAGWSFYEATGTTAHDMNATNHNDGTLKNGVQWVPGIGCPNCAAVRFSDKKDRIEVSDSNSLDLGAAGTVACWVYITDYKDEGGLVHKGEQTNWDDEAYSLQLTNSRRFGFYIYKAPGDGKFVESNNNALPSDNKWYHVAVTWNNTNIKLYVNGVENKSVATGGYFAQNSAGRLIIGAQLPVNNSSYPFEGYIDEVYLYNRALSATEVANMALGHP